MDWKATAFIGAGATSRSSSHPPVQQEQLLPEQAQDRSGRLGIPDASATCAWNTFFIISSQL
ncbi:hypothetical protein CO661_27245 [Sinorhizobium fredii]|uniref:Uncharacterized protein n=1 Tax=Rhizobium fredii TaxID=380 RepID=A0A2A6LRC9_RHIFR|nr:hypothetical protein CO661_27245 [Sinorhizobium fredii]